MFHFFGTGRSHLPNTALEHFADVGRFGQDVHAGDASQVHGGVDIEALGFSRGSPPLHRTLVHLQVAVLHVPLGHDSVPLAQRDRLWAEKDCLA